MTVRNRVVSLEMEALWCWKPTVCATFCSSDLPFTANVLLLKLQTLIQPTERPSQVSYPESFLTHTHSVTHEREAPPHSERAENSPIVQNHHRAQQLYSRKGNNQMRRSICTPSQGLCFSPRRSRVGKLPVFEFPSYFLQFAVM